MEEKGGEGTTGSYWPSGHQEGCSRSGYARVKHRSGLGGGPKFQSQLCRELNESTKWG